MAKRRLLQWMREKLENHAHNVVLPAKEKAALDSAYAKAMPLVRKLVETRYPKADMKVLAKYGHGAADREVKVQHPNGVIDQFVFDKDDAPYVPGGYEHRNRIYLATAETAAAIERWIKARDAYKTERDKRLEAYKALILGSSFVEDIVAVWPEAAKVIPPTALPIALSPEKIALVKNDLKERKAA